MQFSIFPDAFSTAGVYTIELDTLLDHIKDGRWGEQVNRIRRAKTKEERNDLKKSLPAATLSGVFSKRRASGLEEYSGLLQIDIDGVRNPDHTRNALGLDPHILAAFVSPSGTGVKAIMLVPRKPDQHKLAFQAAERYIGETYDLAIDKSCSDVSRAMFVSADPFLKRNPNATPLNVLQWAPEPPKPAPKPRPQLVQGGGDLQRYRAALDHLNSADRELWVKIGMALKAADEISEFDSFALWDAWSSTAHNYKGTDDCRRTWESFRNEGLKPGTLFKLAQDAGWVPPIKKQVIRERPKLEVVEGSLARKPEPEPEPETDGLALQCDEKGRPLKNFYNAKRLLQFHPHFAGHVWYDEFLDIIKTDLSGEVESWRDENTLQCLEWIQGNLPGLELLPESIVQRAVIAAAFDQRRNEAQDWLNSLTWDGTERLDYWLVDHCEADDNTYTRAVGRKWLCSAVARMLQPGVKADQMLVLEGEQGLGKSRLLAALCPKESWFSDSIKSMTGKEAAEDLQGVWIVELPEMHTYRRSDVDGVKAFITRQVDRYRPAYGRHVIERPRSCIFAGTINPDGAGYLRDTTGNRRFWPVLVRKADAEAVEAIRDQLLAEAVVKWRNGEQLWLNDADAALIAAQMQEDRVEVDPWEDALDHFTVTRPQVTMSDCFDHLSIPTERRDMIQMRRIGRILGNRGYTKRTLRVNGELRKVWVKSTT